MIITEPPYYYLQKHLNNKQLSMRYAKMQKASGFNNFEIVSVIGNYYRIHFWHMSKDEAINIMNKSDLSE